MIISSNAGLWGYNIGDTVKFVSTNPYRLVVTGRGIPRSHCAVKDSTGAVVGEVTSGTFSPTRKQGIALALLDRSVTLGDEVVVDVRGREVAATVSKPPFVEVGVREK